MADRQNITLFVGENPPLDFTITTEDGVPPDDFDTATATWVLSNRARTQALITKTTSIGITNDGAGGTLRVTLDPEDTEDLAPGVYYHELRVTIGDVERVTTSGTVTLERSATIL